MALTKINSSVIANNTIAVGNIADNSVDATKIASNSILTRHIDDDQITTDQIAANTIATANIADNAVDGTKIASNSILTRHIDDNQIGIDQINVSDGSNGQALITNGSGTLSFSTITSGLATNAAGSVTSSSAGDVLTLVSTDAGGALGPVLNLHRNSSSPADGDILGGIKFTGESGGSGAHTYGQIRMENNGVTDGQEQGKMIFDISMPDGALAHAFHIGRTEIAVNEDSEDLNFRVESNNQTHMLNVDAGSDAVSIGDDTPTTRFSVLTSETNASLDNISNNGMHIGGTGNTNGYLTSSISMGYKSDGAETYKKVALVTQARGDSAARQDFHILVDDAADSGSAEVANRKFSIDSQTGAVSMLGQAAATIYHSSNWTQSAGANQFTFSSSGHNVGSCYDASNGRFTVTTPGKYLIICQLSLQVSTTGLTYLSMGPRVNGTGTVYFGGWAAKTGSDNQYEARTSSIILDLSANDYLTFYIELSNSHAVLAGFGGTSVSIHKLS